MIKVLVLKEVARTQVFFLVVTLIVPFFPKVGVLLSTTKMQKKHDSHYYITTEPLLSSLAGTIPEGLTIVTQAHVPRICNGSRFCEFVKVIFGKDSLFTAKLTSHQNKVVFDVAVKNASHDALLKYKSIRVSLNVSTDTDQLITD